MFPGTSPTGTERAVRIPAGRPRPAPDDVFAAALSAATGRNRLMLLLAAHAGLRRAEIAQVRRGDLVGRELRVRAGRGGRAGEPRRWGAG